jgi:hypothetical protein
VVPNRRASSASLMLPCFTSKIRIFCAILIYSGYYLFCVMSINKIKYFNLVLDNIN